MKINKVHANPTDTVSRIPVNGGSFTRDVAFVKKYYSDGGGAESEHVSKIVGSNSFD